MRIRTVKPEFWTHEELSTISPEAALLAIGLLNLADDEGYFNAHPRLIEAAIFPLRDLLGKVPGLIQELSEIEYIRVADGNDGKIYGQVCRFREHQRVNKPKASKIKNLVDFQDASRTHPGRIQDASRTHPGRIQDASKGEWKGMEGEKEREGESAPAPVDHEYEYMGEKETLTQQVVAVVMEAFGNWPQSDVEVSVLKFHVTKAGLTLDDWKEIASAAWKGIAPKTPVRAYHQKLSWQMDFHLRQRKAKADGENRETPQQRERREQIEAADRRLREAEERENNNGDGALHVEGRAKFSGGVPQNENDGGAPRPVDESPGRDR